MLKESNNYRQFAKQMLDKGWVKPNKRIFDNTKISDHFAIIPTAAGAEEPVRAGTEAVRPGRDALPGGVFPGGRIPGHDAHHRSRRAISSRPKARCWSNRAGWQVYGKEARRRDEDANLVPVAEGREGQDRQGRRPTAWSPSRPRATPKRRCCRRWKARASWSTTTNCAKRWPARASARRPRARRSSKACWAKSTCCAKAAS